MPRKTEQAGIKLVVANPNRCPKDFPVLEYIDGPKFYEGDIWVRPPQTSLEIEQSLMDRGYLVKVTDG